MTTLTLRTPATCPISVAVKAPAIQLTVEAVTGLSEATLVLSGPDEVIQQASATRVESAWMIALPEPEPTVTRHGNTVFTHSGRGTVIRGSSVVISGGNITVNGVSVGSGTVVEPVTGLLRIPLDSLLATRIDNGSVETRGALSAIDHQGSNADLSVSEVGDLVAESTNGSVTVGRASGRIDAETTNGSVTVARSGPHTKVRSTNGNVTVLAGCPGRISARTTNGNATVHKNGHQVDASTRTTNGRDRVYA
jgi:hypothetical protein